MSNWGNIRLGDILAGFPPPLEVDLLERVIQEVFRVDELTVEGAKQDQRRYL